MSSAATPTSTLSVRWATSDDEAQLLQFTLDEAVEAEGRAERPEVLQAAIRRALQEPEVTARYVVAEREGELLGHASVTKEWSDWNNAHYLWISSMYVTPSARGVGVMSALLEAVDELARELGAPEVRIYVHKTNARGTRAWQREGFEEAPYWMGHRKVQPK